MLPAGRGLHGQPGTVYLWEGFYDSSDNTLNINRYTPYHRYLAVLNSACLFDDSRTLVRVSPPLIPPARQDAASPHVGGNDTWSDRWLTDWPPDNAALLVHQTMRQATHDLELDYSWVDLHEGRTQAVTVPLPAQYRDGPACVDPVDGKTLYAAHDWQPYSLPHTRPVVNCCANCGAKRTLQPLSEWDDGMFKGLTKSETREYAPADAQSLIMVGRLRTLKELEARDPDTESRDVHRPVGGL